MNRRMLPCLLVELLHRTSFFAQQAPAGRNLSRSFSALR